MTLSTTITRTREFTETVSETVTRTVKETTVEKCEFALADAFKLIATSTFRNFTKNDWMSYSGCMSKEPMKALVEWNGYMGDVVLDGDYFEFHFYDQDDELTMHVYTIKADKMDYQAC